jgi:hypothetical protein
MKCEREGCDKEGTVYVAGLGKLLCADHAATILWGKDSLMKISREMAGLE